MNVITPDHTDVMNDDAWDFLDVVQHASTSLFKGPSKPRDHQWLQVHLLGDHLFMVGDYTFVELLGTHVQFHTNKPWKNTYFHTHGGYRFPEIEAKIYPARGPMKMEGS